MESLTRKLIFYPLAFLVVIIFPTINRLNNTFGTDEIFWLYVMHVLMRPGVGLFNAVIYIWMHHRSLYYCGLKISIANPDDDDQVEFASDDEDEGGFQKF